MSEKESEVLFAPPKRQVSGVGRKLDIMFHWIMRYPITGWAKEADCTPCPLKFSPQLFLMANATMAHMMDGSE
jgi:hypothetical protein